MQLVSCNNYNYVSSAHASSHIRFEYIFNYMLLRPLFSLTGDIDYVSTPDPSELTIQRGQEEMCSNITINDDALIEGDEIFTLSLSTLSTNFSAGVLLSPENATIEILDSDGKYRIYTTTLIGTIKSSYWKQEKCM